jgi:hypothetical protein
VIDLSFDRTPRRAVDAPAASTRATATASSSGRAPACLGERDERGRHRTLLAPTPFAFPIRAEIPNRVVGRWRARDDSSK